MRAGDSLLLLGLQSAEREDNLSLAKKESNFLAKVVPADSVVGFVNTYPLDSLRKSEAWYFNKIHRPKEKGV